MEPLPKYILLIPLRYNDGTLIPEELILGFQERLFVMASGFTECGIRKGAYKMADGKKQIDETVEYWIGLPDDRFDELKTAVSELAKSLGQESLYLEKTGGLMYFIPPSE